MPRPNPATLFKREESKRERKYENHILRQSFSFQPTCLRVRGGQGGCSKGSAICLLFVCYLFAICFQIKFMFWINLRLCCIPLLHPSYPLPTHRIVASCPPPPPPPRLPHGQKCKSPGNNLPPARHFKRTRAFLPLRRAGFPAIHYLRGEIKTTNGSA